MTTEREPAELSISFETGEIPARSRAVVRLDLRGAERGFVPTAVVVDEGFQFYILLATCGDEVLLQGDSPQGARVELRAVDPPDGSAVLLLVKNTGDSFRKLRGWLVGRAALSTSDQPFSISDLATRCRGWFRGGMAAALGRPPASMTEIAAGLRGRLARAVDTLFLGREAGTLFASPPEASSPDVVTELRSLRAPAFDSCVPEAARVCEADAREIERICERGAREVERLRSGLAEIAGMGGEPFNRQSVRAREILLPSTSGLDGVVGGRSYVESQIAEWVEQNVLRTDEARRGACSRLDLRRAGGDSRTVAIFILTAADRHRRSSLASKIAEAAQRDADGLGRGEQAYLVRACYRADPDFVPRKIFRVTPSDPESRGDQR